MPDDANLLAALRERSPEAFRELFELYSDRLYRLALGLLRDENEAEDVVQDAFLRLFEKLDGFEGRSRLGTWLYRIVHNLSLDRLRAKRPLADLPDEDDALPLPVSFVDWSQIPEKQLTEAELARYLDQAVAALPEKLRAMFILSEVEGLPAKECAQILEISVSAAKVRLHRARLLLREQLSQAFAESTISRE